MVTMYEVIVSIVGEPADAYQTDMLYMMAVVLSLILIMYFLYIFKLIAGFIRKAG